MRYWIDFSDSCDVTGFAAPSSPTDPLAYEIGGPDSTLNIPSWTNSCGYTESLTFTPDLASYAWITVTGRTVTISSSDTSFHGMS